MLIKEIELSEFIRTKELDEAKKLNEGLIWRY